MGAATALARRPVVAFPLEQVSVLCVRFEPATMSRRRASQLHALAQVDVVGPAVRQRLHPPAGEVVHLETQLLLRADDQALRRIARMDPDGRIVGGIAMVQHGLGLDQGR